MARYRTIVHSRQNIEDVFAYLANSATVPIGILACSRHNG